MLQYNFLSDPFDANFSALDAYKKQEYVTAIGYWLSIKTSQVTSIECKSRNRLRFFTAYPASKEFFKMIKGMPEEQYLENPQFKAHVINLMTALNLAVENLNQPEVVAAMMNKLGESHGRRKIKEQNFQATVDNCFVGRVTASLVLWSQVRLLNKGSRDLKQVIVKMFIEVLKLDDTTLGAWGKAVDFWYKHIFETLNKAEQTR
ncbi:hypothetical protein SFRURICE_001318 [Spodoptera frugiperda]|nr:hypothetical protein SFRURICE_001318 [Spodoptera frugiperda]